MNGEEPIVVIVDDDLSMRMSLESLLRSVGIRTELFDSADAFLKSKRPDAPSCIVLDVRLPGKSGLVLQNDLATAGVDIPIIFISGHGDIPMSVRAMKAGAVEFLPKPFGDQEILDAIEVALQRDCIRRANERHVAVLRRRFETLTAREQQVMRLVIAGDLNKQIAADLSLSETTVKAHRGQVMRKMLARSVAELVRMADKLASAGATKPGNQDQRTEHPHQ
jgi:FixJ family two-component response regulator